MLLTFCKMQALPLRLPVILLAALLFFFVCTAPVGLYAQNSAAPEKKDIPSPEKDEENRIKVLNELVSLKSKLEFCGKIAEDRAQRLRCYDNIAKEYDYIDTDMSRETEEKLARFGFWSVVERKSEIGDISVYLKLDSSNAAISTAGHNRFPTLILRCKNKKTDVYIDWGGALGNPKGQEKKIYIGYRMGSEDENAEEWEFSLDFYSAFAPMPNEFVRNLKGKKKLIVEITPYNQSMATLLFNTEGFENALAMLVDRCYNDLR